MTGALRLLGLEVDRKTDVLALTAFVLAMIGTALQIGAWLRGPQPHFYGPTRVVIYPYIMQAGDQAMRIGAQMSYTNTASKDYAAIVQVEEATLDMGTRQSRQIWNDFAKLRRDADGTINPDYTDDAAPVPIQGGNAISHFTTFTPEEHVCGPSTANCNAYSERLTPKDFAAMLGAGKSMTFTFAIRYFGGKSERSRCVVTVDGNMMDQWVDKGSVVAACHPVEVPFYKRWFNQAA